MGAGVVHWEINASDGPRLQKFFADLFDWKVDAANPMAYGMVDTNVKLGINGGIGQVEPGARAGAIFYVQVEDLQTYLNKAESLGGRVLTPPKEIPGVVTFAVFTDPEGNAIGLIKGPQTVTVKAAPRKRAAASRKAKPRARAKAAPRRRRRK